jgi:hypothetical protein
VAREPDSTPSGVEPGFFVLGVSMSKAQDPTMKLALKIVHLLKRYARDETEGLKAMKIAAIHYSSWKDETTQK